MGSLVSTAKRSQVGLRGLLVSSEKTMLDLVQAEVEAANSVVKCLDSINVISIFNGYATREMNADRTRLTSNPRRKT